MGLPTIPMIVVFTGTLFIGIGYWRFVMYGFFYPERKTEILKNEIMKDYKSDSGNSYYFTKDEIPENCTMYLNQLNQCLKMSKSNPSLCQIYSDDLFECRERFL